MLIDNFLYKSNRFIKKFPELMKADPPDRDPSWRPDWQRGSSLPATPESMQSTGKGAMRLGGQPGVGGQGLTPEQVAASNRMAVGGTDISTTPSNPEGRGSEHTAAARIKATEGKGHRPWTAENVGKYGVREGGWESMDEHKPEGVFRNSNDMELDEPGTRKQGGRRQGQGNPPRSPTQPDFVPTKVPKPVEKPIPQRRKAIENALLKLEYNIQALLKLRS